MDGSSRKLRLKNWRLDSIIEPTARYKIQYYNGSAETTTADGMIGTMPDSLLLNNNDEDADAAHFLYSQTNIAGKTLKYDRQNTLLTTDLFKFYETGGHFDNTLHSIQDHINNTATVTEYEFQQFTLSDFDVWNPTQKHTEVVETIQTAGYLKTTTHIIFPDSGESPSIYLILPVSKIENVTLTDSSNTVLGSANRPTEHYSYEYDTVRTYGSDSALANKFGVDVAKKNHLDPEAG